ncbi:MAG: cyanophycinase-like exopeptidase [Saprospiraceae bacterium]|jgi:cyanophycinase-like exopeptidase
MRFLITFFAIFLVFSFVQSQSYTSYFTGSEIDKAVDNQKFALTVMGGGTEVDYAMRLFLEDAKGGDILVLRTSGSDGYNDYMYSELGIDVNSVETIVCHNRDASSDPYVLERIFKAEAIWFAGGDQWKYLSFWRDTPLQQYINFALLDKGTAIGGTSAGLAIMGSYQFTAENGTVTSEQALADTYNERMTIDNRPFLIMPLPVPIIFDSHFDDPDRRGRLVAFMARIKKDYGEYVMGIGLDEYTAARFEGAEMIMLNDAWEEQEDFTHIYSYDCNIEPLNFIAEPGIPLTWDSDHIKYRKFRSSPSPVTFVKLTNNSVNVIPDEDNAINIVDGEYQISEENYLEFPTPCGLVSSVQHENMDQIHIFPNPTWNNLAIEKGRKEIKKVSVFSVNGKDITETSSISNNDNLDVSNLPPGIYFLKILVDEKQIVRKFIKL